LRGSDFGRAYAAFVDAWFGDLLLDGVGLAVIATGSYGRRELCPASDLDVVLLHEGRRDIKQVAERLWRPIWDAGIRLDHGVRTIGEALAVAEGDLKAALALLDARFVMGDQRLADAFTTRGRELWSRKGKRWLGGLDRITVERHRRAGEVAFLLEPDLKDGRGGLRDLTALAAIGAGSPVPPGGDLGTEREVLLEARVALQRLTRRPSSTLVLQYQDEVARAVGAADADVLMAGIAAAGRAISWRGDDAWRRLRSWLTGPKRRSAFGKDQLLGHDLVVRDDEIAFAPEADPADITTIVQLGAQSALTGLPISPDALEQLGYLEPQLERWPDDARDALVSLLGAGDNAIPVLETLDQHGLLAVLIPEWQAVRSRPQRNAFHQFTVDRHLMETAAQATKLTRQVTRPDLLLVAAFLHDLGKGYPGDHTDVGVVLIDTIATRMGFTAEDVATLTGLVRDHLLLPSVATSRDLGDPGVIDNVAERVRDVETLMLLYALTEADARATGPTAWTPWRAELVGELVELVHSALAGSERLPGPPPLPLPEHPPPEALVHGAGDTVRVVARDRPGVFAACVGLLGLHGQDIRAARARSDHGVAASEFDIDPAFGRIPDWHRFQAELREALASEGTLAPRLEHRARTYASQQRPGAARTAEPLVLVHRDESPTAVILEIRAADGIGLLFRIASAIADAGLDIRHAKISTLGHEVIDTFYVVDATTGGRPSDARLGELESNLLVALSGRSPHRE
jgi:[protein-PII] uridylyltransferase